MSFRVGSAAYSIAPVAPVVRVRSRAADDAAFSHNDQLSIGSEAASRWSDNLRRQRSDALAELKDVAPSNEDVSQLRRLDREQLAAMVYDRDGRFSLEQRRGALAQLDQNDRDFLQRARDMAEASSDDRVLNMALVDLEMSKSPIERAVPLGSESLDVAALRRDVAMRTRELGGAPQSLSLHYPSGFTAPDSDAPANAASAGAVRITSLYRDALF